MASYHVAITDKGQLACLSSQGLTPCGSVATALMWPSTFAAGCADTIDIGEQSYSMVLADDLDNNGRLDLLVSTMNGNVYALETSAVYHPMKAWTSVVRQALLM